MSLVQISTDFSDASRHALDYTCLLLQDRDVRLELLYVFTVPFSYTAEGIALAAAGDSVGEVEALVDAELSRVRSLYPGMTISGKVLTGSFQETLRGETRQSRPRFLVLGTADFAELYPGEPDPLNALRRMEVPVLFVPQGAPLRPVRHIAYACNYTQVGVRTPIPSISAMVDYLGADLQVVHADPQPPGYDAAQTKGEQWLKGQLAALQPTFHWTEDGDVVQGISRFIDSHEIDCLFVVPRKLGVWQSLFHKSRTKALARLNKIPVMSFHEDAG